MTAPAPYPADTDAKGWRFELDHERIRRSDTWALATPEIRPWLLMLWMTAWGQTPCGSLPADDELIAAHIGMPIEMFEACKKRLMRGWVLADDGRLYHDTMTERVLEMLNRRDGERQRKADYRARMEAEQAGSKSSSSRRPAKSRGSPEMSHGTDAGQATESNGKVDTGTGTSNSVEPDGSTGAAAPEDPTADGGAQPADPDPSRPAGLTAAEALFQVGVPWLVDRGMKESNARSLLGGARKQLGEIDAWNLMASCIRDGVLEPGAFISKAVNEHIAMGKGGRSPNRKGDRSNWNERMAATRAAAEGGSPREKDMGVIDATAN